MRFASVFETGYPLVLLLQLVARVRRAVLVELSHSLSVNSFLNDNDPVFFLVENGGEEEMLLLPTCLWSTCSRPNERRENRCCWADDV